MQRYFIHPEQFVGDQVSVTGDDAHHLIRVMRAKLGDKIIVSNGVDREGIAEVIHIEQQSATAQVREWQEFSNEPKVQVHIAQSLPKADKMDTIIQKCTELGASRFIPFTSERTIVQYDDRKEAKRQDRWHKIAKEAAEQAHRNLIPTIQPAIRWRDLLAAAAQYDLALLCYEQRGDKNGIRTVLHDVAVDSSTGNLSILIIVGPEGGFTEQEVLQADEAGIRVVGLGPRILRTETAAMAGLTCILYEFNEMGGA